MATSHLRESTEPAVFVQEVAKQDDVFVRTTAFWVLESARASFWLDKIARECVERFNEDFPKPELVLSTGLDAMILPAIYRIRHAYALPIQHVGRRLNKPATSIKRCV